MNVLDKIFKELESEAIPAEWYTYEIKRTNQIIRANVEPLEMEIKKLNLIALTKDGENDELRQQIKHLKDSINTAILELKECGYQESGSVLLLLKQALNSK